MDREYKLTSTRATTVDRRISQLVREQLIVSREYLLLARLRRWCLLRIGSILDI